VGSALRRRGRACSETTLNEMTRWSTKCVITLHQQRHGRLRLSGARPLQAVQRALVRWVSPVVCAAVRTNVVRAWHAPGTGHQLLGHDNCSAPSTPARTRTAARCELGCGRCCCDMHASAKRGLRRCAAADHAAAVPQNTQPPGAGVGRERGEQRGAAAKQLWAAWRTTQHARSRSPRVRARTPLPVACTPANRAAGVSSLPARDVLSASARLSARAALHVRADCTRRDAWQTLVPDTT
jgi:hypothetical protein